MKKALSSVAGVKKVDLNFGKKLVTVNVEKAKKDVNALIKAIEEAGFTAKAR